MKRSVLCIVALLMLVAGGAINATSQIRTSLLNLTRGVFHMPLDYVPEAWWFNQMGEEDAVDCLWNSQFWTAGYARSANKAYLCHRECLTPTDCDAPVTCPIPKKTSTGSLASLWFGADSFTADQAFFGGALTAQPGTPPFNANLAVSQISPRFDYSENGLYFGFNIERTFGCEGNWHVTGRVSLPYKVIEVRPDETCRFEETVNDLVKDVCLVCDAGQTHNVYDFAYRLDLLSTLIIGGAPNSTTLPLVQYGPSGANYATKIGSIVGQTSPDTSPVYLIKREDGTLPNKVELPNSGGYFACGKEVSQVNGGVLPGDGSGIENSVYFFGDTSVNYAPLANSKAAQRTLFVVPNIVVGTNPNDGTPTLDEFRNNTLAVRNQILQLLNTFALQDTALEFLCKQCCIDLRKFERNAGLGDLYGEVDLGYSSCDRDKYGHVVLGVTFPTGSKNYDARRVFLLPTGNNNHYEIKVGLEGGWRICNWVGLRADVFFNHAFNATEKVAAPFQGATIKNIGPSADAKVNWNYFEAELELNLFHPYNPDLGAVIGYQLYAKMKDHVNLCNTTAVDCLGRVEPLDADVLRDCTNSIANKIRGEIFHRWNYFELFGGAYAVVSGRNIMKELEWHIGLSIYF